ncbi:MAG TPA: class II aldolase/adducin family protein [Kofleriaceae bacterium]|nr:class II aldolase/adducin family protein [Kofleriaceae bacterium]
MQRAEIIQAMCGHARSLFERGFTVAAGGNLSHRLGDGFLMEATATSLGRLGPGDFVLCDASGAQAETGPLPSREVPLHAAIYRQRPDAQAVVHLHAASSIALGCLAEPTDTGNVLPPVSVYAALRVGRVPLIEYVRPGTAELAARVGDVCRDVNALLLANHGLVAWAPTLDGAVDIAEELEQCARIWLATGGRARVLTEADVAALRQR